jgi:hypothetical protein
MARGQCHARPTSFTSEKYNKKSPFSAEGVLTIHKIWNKSKAQDGFS